MAQEKKREIQVEAMWFASGTAVFMACLERGILVLSFFEQWRVLVFIALNLLLLAILLTSTPPIFSSSDDVGQEPIGYDSHQGAGLDNLKSAECESGGGSESESENQDVGEAEVKDMGEGKEMSKEELNERVEAFIAMFRQHLASDGKGKSFSRRILPAESMKGGDNVNKRRGRGSNFRNSRFGNR